MEQTNGQSKRRVKGERQRQEIDRDTRLGTEGMGERAEGGIRKGKMKRVRQIERMGRGGKDTERKKVGRGTEGTEGRKETGGKQKEREGQRREKNGETEAGTGLGTGGRKYRGKEEGGRGRRGTGTRRDSRGQKRGREKVGRRVGMKVSRVAPSCQRAGEAEGPLCSPCSVLVVCIFLLLFSFSGSLGCVFLLVDTIQSAVHKLPAPVLGE